ncbi:MAG: hypothetical protein IMF19_11670 [Proteobacteria bacterium]|nr:hypothetical protein [Pseudomonadota bacterium]
MDVVQNRQSKQKRMPQNFIPMWVGWDLNIKVKIKIMKKGRDYFELELDEDFIGQSSSWEE